ncbi:MAG: hypothetical protein H0V07_04145 [Propionibacteriales bacterium]|nr:hypothetical protein [Propionibacteriales bacterium]
MVILGLLLLLLAVVVAIAAIYRGGEPAQLDLQVFKVTTNITGIYLAGALTLLVAVLGLLALMYGLRHDRRRRAQIKELKQQAAQPEQQAAPPRQPRPAPAAPPSRETTQHSSLESTSAEVADRNNDGPDEHFHSAPRDSR